MLGYISFHPTYKPLRKFANALMIPTVKPVYAFDSDGNFTRYESAKETSKELSINMTGIRECLSGQRSISKGHRFFYAENFEKVDENGQIVIDYEKIDEISEEINPAIKKLMSKYGKIYALNGVNVKEFKNIRQAARELGISQDTILYFLKNNRSPEDGKNSIQGFVFTSEKDD